MPIYGFQCGCGLRFDAAAPMKDNMKPKTCPDCGKEAPRALPKDVQGVFNQPVTGPVPQNTGVSQVDANIDRAIGRSAREGWQVQEQRTAEKRVIAEESGARGPDLSRNPDGSYRVLPKEERAIHARAVTINHLALDALSEKP